MTTFLAPLLLGIAGSLHCVGMCGPLLLAFQPDAAGKRQMLNRLLVYHAARILTYALLGVLFGLLGQGLAMAGLQKVLSVTAGIFMLAMALTTWQFEHILTALPGFGAFTRHIKSGLGRLLQRHPDRSLFFMGMFNGLLPCGMVYVALAGAVASAGGVAGGLFLAFFGLGTLPLLLMVSMLGHSLSVPLRRRLKMVRPVLFTLAGLLLLQRGLHIDLSLFESAVPKAGFDCH